MSGKQAKRIRKEIYGDYSIRMKRQYLRNDKGTLINEPDGLRDRYLKAKREFKYGNP